jgi:transcriptional/translational regulatory protein YebC/TACO1
MADKFLNAEGASLAALGSVAVEFGVGYLFSKDIKRKNEELLKKIAQLNEKQAEILKQRLSEVATEVAKTGVIIAFLDEEEIKKLSAETKRKRIIPFIVLGFSVLIVSVLFFKLSTKKNG